MVLAAGLGKRMRPITDTIPKPLVRIGGRTMLDQALDRLAEAGIETAVVNVHHHADLIEKHLAGRTKPRIVISDERAELLETGGGIVQSFAVARQRAFSRAQLGFSVDRGAAIEPRPHAGLVEAAADGYPASPRGFRHELRL